MRQLFTFLLFTVLVTAINAQISKTVNVTTAGTLYTLLTAVEKTSVTNLTITGDIDARDVKCMRDSMSVLAVIDISEVTIKEYTGSGILNEYLTTYSDNVMPLFSFSTPGPDNNDGKATLTTIKLPKSITSIGFHCFFRCKGIIGNLTIPTSVTSIEEYAFSECSATGIISMNTTPPTASEFAFLGMTSSVYVPGSAVNAYKLAPGWSKTNIFAIESDINELISDNYNISIYPNPVKDELKIESKNCSTFEILDLMGQVVYNGNLIINPIVQTSNLLPLGVYLIRFKTGKTFAYKKIIKE